MSNKDIPDQAETKRVQSIIANAITDHIVDANKKVETPEEAAERYGTAVSISPTHQVASKADFLAGVRWAEERGRK
jgi:hypothetical protein